MVASLHPPLPDGLVAGLEAHGLMVFGVREGDGWVAKIDIKDPVHRQAAAAYGKWMDFKTVRISWRDR